MKSMHLWPEDWQEDDGQITVAATVEYRDGRRDRLWYRLGVEHKDSLTEMSDPFVIGVLFRVMKEARVSDGSTELVVHGQVSPTLIQNLEECQSAWAMWIPDLYRQVSIRADVEREAPLREGADAGVMCFSGGVDSAFSAFRHSRFGGRPRIRPLKAGVMVQGMEFRLDQTEIYARAEARSRRMLDSLGMGLIRVVTNFKEINTHWGYCHGSAVASCLAILQRRFAFGLIAQTMTYGNNSLTFEGVNPITDWLYSSDTFRLIPDGASSTRMDKISAMKDWPEFIENVRVCAQDETRKAENCCECGKCIRTILQFRALGLGLPSAFPNDVSLDMINRMMLGPRGLGLNIEPLLKEIKNREIDEPWVHALERAVKRSRRAVKMVRRPRWIRLPYSAYRKFQFLVNGE